MMKLFKRLFTVTAIVISLSLIFTGCGNGNQQTKEKPKVNSLSANSVSKSNPGKSNKTKMALKHESGIDSSKVKKIQPKTYAGKKTLIRKGESARDFDAQTIDGKSLKLSSFKGKYILIDFWATWCGPCRREMPYMSKLAGKYKDNKDFVILGVSLDKSKTQIPTFLKKHHLDYAQVYDGKGWNNAVASLYGITSIPMTVLIDPEFNVIGTGYRGPRLLSKIDELLNKKQG